MECFLLKCNLLVIHTIPLLMITRNPNSLVSESRADNHHLNAPPQKSSTYVDEIREILDEQARLSVPVAELAEFSDLYAAGLTSLTTVNLMLALEDCFQVEFPDRMLGRKTFESIQSISEAISELLG